jgi:hypothetical protein
MAIPRLPGSFTSIQGFDVGLSRHLENVPQADLPILSSSGKPVRHLRLLLPPRLDML